MRILIIDDHPIIRKGLLHLLEQELQQERIEADEADCQEDAASLLAEHQYDLVLLDISLGGRSGLDLLKKIRQEQPSLPVLIISMHPEDQYALRTIRMGAAGYLSKHAAPDDLITAITQIRSNGTYLSPTVSRLLADEISRTKRSSAVSHELLSDREMEVAGLLAAGCPSKQIAHDLNISLKTVHTHRARLMKKLQLANNAELAAYFIRSGLL